VAGSRRPVVVARDRSSGRAYLIRTTRSGRFSRITATGARPALANLILNAGDWDVSGRGDVITRSSKTGQLYLYRGLAGGRLGRPRKMSRSSFARIRFLTAVGDMTGDGRPDLLGQPRGRPMRIYPGNGSTGFGHSYIAHSALGGRKQLGMGLWNSDGAPDTVLLSRSRALVLYQGNGPGGLTGGRVIRRLKASYDWVLAVGDLTGDDRADLVARSSRTHRLYTIAGVPGGFAKRRLFTTGMGRFDIAG